MRSPARAAASPRDDAVRLRMALEAAGMVTWEWDLCSGVIRYSENVPNLARGKAIRPYTTVTRLLQTVHPEDRGELARALDATLAQRTLFDCEYRVRMLDGAYHWIHGMGKLMFLKDGRPYLVLGISQDITKRKRAEAELQKRSRQLARLATEITLVEHRERRRLADALHEGLQQIIVGARIHAHALAAAEKRPKQRRYDALLSALDEMLTISSSVTRGLAPPVRFQKDPALALQWVAQDMRKRHNLAVDVRAGASLAGADEASAVLLFSAARELLLNVVKHSATLKASVRLRRCAGRIELEVLDHGRGLQPAKTPAPDHHGFGLFSIRERAELLGGELTIDSSAGRGTRVVLTLPVPPRQPKETPCRS